jgi:hypothetical protein
MARWFALTERAAYALPPGSAAHGAMVAQHQLALHACLSHLAPRHAWLADVAATPALDNVTVAATLDAFTVSVVCALARRPAGRGVANVAVRGTARGGRLSLDPCVALPLLTRPDLQSVSVSASDLRTQTALLAVVALANVARLRRGLPKLRYFAPDALRARAQRFAEAVTCRACRMTAQPHACLAAAAERIDRESIDRGLV